MTECLRTDVAVVLGTERVASDGLRISALVIESDLRFVLD